MIKRTLFFLITAAVLSSAWFISEQKKAKTEISKSILYPNLINEVNLISKIRIRSRDQTTTIEKDKDSWILVENDEFPAKPDSVRAILLQLTRLTILEKKTTSRKGHNILGVNSLDEEGLPRRQITLSNDRGESMLDLIVGKAVKGSKDRHYVRQSHSDQSWIADGELDFIADPVSWLDARILDVPPESIKSVRITQTDKKPILIEKTNISQTFFKLKDVPDNRIAKSATLISSFGSLLVDLRFNNVLSSKRLSGIEALRRTKVATFDNIQITLTDYLLEQDAFTEIKFEKIDGLEEKTKDWPEDIKEYATKTENWIYQLPKYKRRIIERKFSSLIKMEK